MPTLIVPNLDTVVEALHTDDFQLRCLNSQGYNFLGRGKGFVIQCGRAYDLDRRTDLVDLTYDWSGQVSLTSPKKAVLQELMNTYQSHAVRRALHAEFGVGNFDIIVTESSGGVQYRIERIFGDEMKKVTITCKRDGTVVADNEGFQGEECVRLTERLQRNLGTSNIIDDELKPEFYDQVQVTEEQTQ